LTDTTTQPVEFASERTAASQMSMFAMTQPLPWKNTIPPRGALPPSGV
jgi:hypothetical protein